MTWTYHAQRARTKTWLDHDLQLLDTALTWQLTGPGQLTANVDAITAKQLGSDGRPVLDEWSTLIYAEDDNVIRWGGILTSSADIGDGNRSLSCTSFSGYPAGRIWTDELTLQVADAFDVIRMIWDFVQRDERGDLGVIVSENAASFILGSGDPGPYPVQAPGESDADFNNRVLTWQTLVNDPYELAWWNSPDMGNEINNIMSQAGADYLERHVWSENRLGVNHYIDLYADNRISRRNDLKFFEGENLKVAPQPERDGEAYANFVRGLGAGEDRNTLSFDAYAVDDGRLRRDMVFPAKNILSPGLLQYQTTSALINAQSILKFDTVDVVDHPNAPLGSWDLGDEILIETFSGFEPLSEWMRITEWTFSPDAPDSATLRLVKSSG